MFELLSMMRYNQYKEQYYEENTKQKDYGSTKRLRSRYDYERSGRKVWNHTRNHIKIEAKIWNQNTKND